MKIINLSNKTFGRLFVIRQAGVLSSGKANLKAWLCRCSCGNEKIIRGRDIRTGNTTSCGCFARERKSIIHRTHGLSGTPLYRLWADIKKRCSSNASKRHRRVYKDISICKKWQRFENFFNWAMPKYRKGLDIDRINTFGGYSPNNCRFVTRKINTQNTKRSKWWYVNGIKFNSSTDAAKHFGVRQSTIFAWCMGKKSGKYSYLPKENCYAVRKYKEIKNDNN